MSAMKHGDVAAMVLDQNGEGAEGDPRQFVLRAHPEIDGVMASLEGLGVDWFTIVLRFRYPDDADVFPTFPVFRKGGRFSAARIEGVQRAHRELSALVQEAVSGTGGEDQELLVEAVVVVTRDSGKRGITAYTTVMVTDLDSDFRDRPIELF